MLGVIMVLGFMFGFMIVLGVLGWAVEKVAQRNRHCRRNAPRSRRREKG